MEAVEILESGLQQLALPTDQKLVERLFSFQVLLLRWNKKTNLTAITEPAKVVTHHLLDSLAIHQHVIGKEVLDVGSGAGLPGIPLALIKPDKDFILLDSNGKKTSFMTQAQIELGLDNVTVVKSRIEDFEGQFDHVVSRAFTNLGDFVELCRRLLKPAGSLLAMKGPGIEDELVGVDSDLAEVHRIVVPNMQAERFLVEISNT